VNLKIVPKAACDYKILPKAGHLNVYWRNSTNESEGKPEQIFDAAYGTVFRISVFKEASRNFTFIFHTPS
jgi:hypothetical protein